MAAPRQPIRHGTVTGYSRGCHCAQCRHARRDYMRSYRKHGPKWQGERQLAPGWDGTDSSQQVNTPSTDVDQDVDLTQSEGKR